MDAVCALAEWEIATWNPALAENPPEAEPAGWMRHKRTMRRRPDGEIAKQYYRE